MLFLDDDLKNIIRKNSHLVRHNEDLARMEQIMEAIAVHQYRMEIWQHIEGIFMLVSHNYYQRRRRLYNRLKIRLHRR